jgi:glycine/D-amino acid oxidase-like deaminating enzyme
VLVRVCVVGGGLAGSLLAWRLARLPDVGVDVVLGQHRSRDATDASGGAVRAYEPLAAQRELAIASTTELLGSPVLRQWAGYRQAGFVYLRESDENLAAEVAEIERELPGSAKLVPAAAAFGGTQRSRGYRGPAGTAVVEERAGYISPNRLRDAILTDLAGRPRVSLHDAALEAAEASSAGAVQTVVDGSVRDYDVVVLAVGAWTPGFLRGCGLPAGPYRTKSIQYTVYATGEWCPPPFAEEASGLYGKPTADGDLLLGVPTTEWDVPPGRSSQTPAWRERGIQLAADRFPMLRLGAVRSWMSAADCYCDPPILALREVADSTPQLLTFTGGSGGSVKTVLAASERAANQLAHS